MIGSLGRVQLECTILAKYKKVGFIYHARAEILRCFRSTTYNFFFEASLVCTSTKERQHIFNKGSANDLVHVVSFPYAL